MSDSGVNDQPDSNTAESGTDLPKPLPGAQLAAYREQHGWTVEQVASQLNLAPRQIVAIEHDDYGALPGMPIVRGFVRAYAKLLKVDAAPLLVQMVGESIPPHDSLAPRKTLSTPFSEARLPSMTERPGISSKWVVGALVVVLLGVAVWAMKQGTVPAIVPPPASVPAADSAASAAGEQPQSASGKEDGGTSAPQISENQLPAASATPSATQAPASELPTSEAKSAAAAVPESFSAASKDTLQLKAREDSWIEVRSAGNNSVLLSRIVKAGETEKLEVTEPVSVVIGNASGVEATLRGAPVELNKGSKSNVARLNLK
ncbi:helix-turn-helix domain-containing protein [Herbaspirillum sp. HC18]|nr:helix-turn-helix domain-containing protein [Herbaspirillum sp. HC18]